MITHLQRGEAKRRRRGTFTTDANVQGKKGRKEILKAEEVSSSSLIGAHLRSEEVVWKLVWKWWRGKTEDEWLLEVQWIVPSACG